MPVTVHYSVCRLCISMSFSTFNFHHNVLNSNELHILFVSYFVDEKFTVAYIALYSNRVDTNN